MRVLCITFTIFFGVFLLLSWLPAFGEILTGQVVRVIDGDTFDLEVGSEQYRIRLSEIDTPERNQPWGTQASQALRSKILHKTVIVSFENKNRSYDRIVGKVWLGNLDINREMVHGGHAWIDPRYMNDASLLEQEAIAKQENTGLWRFDNPIPPWEWREGIRQTIEDSETSQISQCGTKTFCREMGSCDEAMFYLKQCGLTRLDGDSDGMPCEAICR